MQTIKGLLVYAAVALVSLAVWYLTVRLVQVMWAAWRGA